MYYHQQFLKSLNDVSWRPAAGFLSDSGLLAHLCSRIEQNCRMRGSLKFYFLFQTTINLTSMLARLYKKISPTKASDFFWTDVNQRVVQTQYAVKGIVPSTADQMKDELATNSNKYPFDEITFCSISNPHEFHQKPITFNRQVAACMLNPNLNSLPGINPDAAKRAQSYLKEIISAGSYSHSLGIPLVRRSIARFLAVNDGIPEPKIEHIFTTEGASQGIHLLLSTIITDPNSSIMLPIPTYPLFSAAITLYGGHGCPYYLNEERGWQLDHEELERSISSARKAGKTVKAIVVINPGNPTGAIFSEETIQKILEFAVKNKLVVITDEVYRDNFYKENAVFSSFRKVLENMPTQVKNNCELASLHSASKGLVGESGLRGGYLYMHNFNPKVLEQLVKLKSISLCSSTPGQAMVELMCNPPTQDVSQSTKELYLSEKNALFQSLKHRAAFVSAALNDMDNISSCESQGAMCAFPQVRFSKKAIEAAGDRPVDEFYCLQVLKNTGIVLVPGSGFKQREGTHHFRITTLILPEEKLKRKLAELKSFNNEFHRRYQ